VVFDGLVGYKRVGGVDGSTLVPDLASALPEPTDNGRAYTFRLRKGIKFADGRALKASDVRSSLERLFNANPAEPEFYEGILGAGACRKRPKDCNLSTGVIADDNTGSVTIRLRAPDPDFLNKLAMPWASIVPTGTPARGKTPIPGTGPYWIAEYEPGRRLRLVRNRHFRVWSKAAQPEGIPDEILLDTVGDADAGLTAVQRGRADISNVPPDRLPEVRTRYASQLHVTPRAGGFFLALNTKRPPFDEIRARRAVAFAVDRARLVQGVGGNDIAATTCQLLPQGLAGYRRYCPHTVRPTDGGPWAGPDLERARDLVAQSGTKGMQVDVLGVGGKGFFPALTTVLHDTLQQLGYRTSLQRKPDLDSYFPAMYAGAARVEAALQGWFIAYPAPGGFLPGLLSCDGAPYACNDPAIDRKIRRVIELETRNPHAANEAWSRLDRDVVDNAFMIPVITVNAIDFVSKRVGNYQRHPVYGILISQLWVSRDS
jgi:peptide/nickel transport system substrate-binding protein